MGKRAHARLFCRFVGFSFPRHHLTPISRL
jgi:hypothetical protein